MNMDSHQKLSPFRKRCELEQRSPSGTIELLVFDSEKPVGVYWGSKVSTWLNKVCKM